MAKLTAEEQAQLDALTKKQEQPDDPPGGGGGRSEQVSVVIDLSDENAVERGLRLGFITEADLPDEEEDEDGKGGGKEKDEDGAPKRGRKNVLTRGYGDE